MESDDDSDVGDILDDLLANANDIDQSTPEKKLEELKFNFLDSQTNAIADKTVHDEKSSLVHEQNLDSSDDEDKQNFEQQKYSEYGREVKNLLKNDGASKPLQDFPKIHENASKPFEKSSKTPSTNSFDFNTAAKKIVQEKQVLKPKDVYSDPVFGFRLITPLISSTELIDRMKGKKAVTVSRVKSHLSTEGIHDDWVIAGVLINRSPTKTSQTGSQYCIWKLTDLGEQMNTVSIFLFSGAYKLFWKTATGTVIGILNPNVMDSRDNTNESTLSVDNAKKLMILGKSRDMGKCKSSKKNGEPCSNIVDLSQCEYCVYHVKQEYKKASKRADIQSNGSSGGFSSSMGKKTKAPLAGMYSQGLNNQNFTPILAKRNEKLFQKDSARLALLRGTAAMPNFPAKSASVEVKKKSCSVELTGAQMKKDLQRLNKLRGWSTTNPMGVATSEDATKVVAENKKASSFQASSLGPTSSVPRLGAGVRGGRVDFSQPITKRHVDNARSNALRWIKNNGTLKASNPNKICASRDKKLTTGVKRQREGAVEDLENENDRKRATINDKFKEMMEAKSAHVDLVEQSLDEEKDKYFDKLAIKERMEEKMMSTFKVDCKAVKCLVCKYTAYSSSDYCKEQKHPLRVIDAVKSFFKCNDCGNRTTSLDRIPSESCKKCQGSHWVRAAMMAEKRTDIPSAVLSIRGGEEKFIGSISQDANINLLVPDSGTGET